MADIGVTKYRARLVREGTMPAIPANPSSDPVNPVNPPGSGAGIPIVSGVTNEIAYFTDSNTISSLSTATYPSLTELSYVKGVTSAIQAQLNAKIGGSLTAGRIPFATGVNTLGDDSGLVWDNVNKNVQIGQTNLKTRINESGISISRDIDGLFVANIIRSSVSTRNSIGFDYISNLAINAHRFYTETSLQALNISSVSFGGGLDSTTYVQAYNFRSNFYSSPSNVPFSIVSDDASGSQVGIILNRTNRTGVGTQAIVQFQYNSVEVARFTTSGLLGIATTSPTNTQDVNGTARIRTINNLGTTTTSVLVPSATGVISSRTVSEFRTDIGAIQESDLPKNKPQIISVSGSWGDLTGVNSDTKLIILSGASANIDGIAGGYDGRLIRLYAFAGAMTLNNDTGATGSNRFAIFNNRTITQGAYIDLIYYNERWRPHVVESGVSQTTGTFTPTMTATGGISYTFTVENANYVKQGKIVHFSISLTGISSTGSSSGELQIGNLPFSAVSGNGKFWFSGIVELSGSSYSKDALLDLRGRIAQSNNYISINGVWSTWNAPTFSSGGVIRISGFYETT